MGFLDKTRVVLRPLLLPTFCLAQILDALNISGANVALPHIHEELGFTVGSLQWIISAYALTFGGFLLLAGRLGDVYGHRNFFILGLLWFAIFAVIVGYSNSPTMMIIARGFQGMGAAATVPNAVALIIRSYEQGRPRNRAMSIFGSTGAMGFVIGLIAGGLVTESSLGWRWIFHISAMVSSLMAVLGILVIPKAADDEDDDIDIDVKGIKGSVEGEGDKSNNKKIDVKDNEGTVEGESEKSSEKTIDVKDIESAVEAKGEKRKSNKQTIDVLGAVLSTGSLLLLVYVLTDANTLGWSNPRIISLLIVSVVMMVAFIFTESRIKQPLMPLWIWSLPNFAPAFVIAACLVGFFQGYLYFVTLIFQELFHYSPLQAAFHFLPLGIVAAIVAVSVEKIIYRFNIKRCLIAGLALGTMGNIILGWYNAEDQYWMFAFPSFIIMMAGLASVYVSASIVAVDAAPSHVAGIVGGMLNTAFQAGGGLGLAILVAVASSVNPAGAPASEADHFKSYHAALWTGQGLIVLSLVIAIFFIKSPESIKSTEEMEEVVVNVEEEVSKKEGVEQRVEEGKVSEVEDDKTVVGVNVVVEKN